MAKVEKKLLFTGLGFDEITMYKSINFEHYVCINGSNLKNIE